MSTLQSAHGQQETSSAGVYEGSGRTRSWVRASFRLPVFGRPFFHPVVDLLFICGGFSLPFLLVMQSDTLAFELKGASMVALLVVFNYAHFASSTVRLYTKHGAAASHRFLAYGFPVVALVVTFLAIGFPERIGQHFTALVLTWSPFHYAAQAYGLALMYSYRSGKMFSPIEKRWLFWICMLPFIRALLNIDDTSIAQMMGVAGVAWLLPESLLTEGSVLAGGLRWLVAGMTPLAYILPIAYACFGRARLPVVALVLVLVNALWLTAYSLFDAVVWATVAHSVQYLFIVSYAHSKDTTDVSGRKRSERRPMLHFYLISMLTGPVLFIALPMLIHAAGLAFGQPWEMSHVYLMVVAAINLHHFIVNGYIWRSKPVDRSATLSPA